MIRGLARAGVDESITVIRVIIINRLPLRQAHEILVHIKPRHRHIRGHGIALAIQGVPYREHARGDQRHPGGRVEGEQQVGIDGIGDMKLNVIYPASAAGQ